MRSGSEVEPSAVRVVRVFGRTALGTAHQARKQLRSVLSSSKGPELSSHPQLSSRLPRGTWLTPNRNPPPPPSSPSLSLSSFHLPQLHLTTGGAGQVHRRGLQPTTKELCWQGRDSLWAPGKGRSLGMLPRSYTSLCPFSQQSLVESLLWSGSRAGRQR